MMHETAQAMFAQHAMTGNDDRQGIRAASLADGQCSRAKQVCQCAIGLRVAAWNVDKRLPDTLLEKGSRRTDGQIETECRLVQVGLKLTAGFFCDGVLRYGVL